MNKRMLAVALLAIVAVLCMTMVACNTAHEHVYETNWSYNETEHWHKCTGCDEVSDKAAHSGGKATCTAKAICEVCGQPYGKTGDHEWGEWQQTKAPTCTEKGTETRVCKNNPEHTETRDVEKVAHDVGTNWLHDETNHWKECTVCHTKSDIAAHNFGEWTEVTAPTYVADGAKKRTCNTCGYSENGTIDKLVAVSSITIDGEQTLTLKVNEVATLVATVLPDNATDKTIEWTSSDNDVVEVARGRLLAHKAGDAVITATAKDGQGAKATVTVKVIVEAESVEVSGEKHVAINGTVTLAATVAPENATDKTVTWTTDNDKIATVDKNGVLTGVAEGKVVVTATTANGKTANISVYVTKVAIDGTQDEVYNTVDAFATNGEDIVTVKDVVLFGDKGLYMFADITDKFVGKNSHMECVLTFGDTVADGKTFQVRLYANGSIRAFKYDSTIVNSNVNWKWGEDKGKSDLIKNIIYTVKKTETGYAVEMFASYEAFGVTEKPEKMMIHPGVWAYTAADLKSSKMTNGLYKLGEADLLSTEKCLAFDQYGYAAKMTSPAEVVANAGDLVSGVFKFAVTVKGTINSQQTIEGLTFNCEGFDSSWVTEAGKGVYNFAIPQEKQAEFESGKTITVINGKHGACGTFILTLSNAIPVQSIEITGAAPTIVGGTVNLGVTYNPANADIYKDVTWTTDNEQIATVENGVVTGTGLGVATITATTANGKTASAKILVAETLIDGNIDDELYANTIPLHNDTLKYKDAVATNPITDEIRVIFGEKGLFITHKVVDGFVGEQTRLETFICTGDKPAAASGSQAANMYYFRFYVHPEKGKFFTNVYNGKSGNFPWNTDVPLELFYVITITEKGYNVEVFIPYSTIALTEKPQTINFLSQQLFYAADGTTFKNAVGNYYGIEQAMLIDINNYWKFDSMGYHSSNNASFGTINSIEDITLGTDKVVDGMYATEFTVKSTIQGYDSFSAVSGLTFDCEYITEIGNGKYKIAVPQDKQADFATGVIVKVMRGTEEVGKFALKLTKDIPVTSVKISGPDAAFIGGENVQYTATVIPDNATHPEVTWDSSDKEVATIDQSGNVTIVAAGTTTITATAGGIIAEHTLVIGEALTKEAVVKVTYANGTVVNSGTGSDIVIDTVTRNTDSKGKNATAFEHTDNNTFVKGLNGDANGALQTNNSTGSYLLVKDYNLGTNDFTISAWVYVADMSKLSGGGGSQLWGTCSMDAKISGLVLGIRNNGKIAYKLNGHASQADKGYAKLVDTSSTALKGWHKYTMTRSGNKVMIYFDGQLKKTETIAAANLDFGTQTICFGAYINETWAYQNYNIAYDNVAIYDYALTANQIAALTAGKM
uniref:Ig-like domain-containing protein n=1 Tax=Candidatus Fimenecus sp. TaxID=3022888 RepID=UPI004025A31F